jgi:large subunit ribosomal protein L10
MSKPVKALLRKELTARLSGVESLAILSLAGVSGVANNRLRRELRSQDIRLTVVQNSVARQALGEVGLAAVSPLIDGPCALVIGGESCVSVVRQLLGKGKEIPSLSVRGAYMEGEVFGPDRIDELSKYPTRDEALARLSGQILSAGGNLVGIFRGPGARLAGILKAIQDRAEGAESN